MHFSPATWQLMVTFTPPTVLMVPPTSTVMVGSSVLNTVPRDVFTSGFPEGEKERDILLDGGFGYSLETRDDQQGTRNIPRLFPLTVFSFEKTLTVYYKNHPSTHLPV